MAQISAEGVTASTQEETAYLADPAVFESPDVFQQALSSTETPLEVRAQLEELESIWAQLSVAERANSAWNEHIRPDVVRAEQALQDLRGRGYRLTGHLEELELKLSGLGNAAYNHDLDGITHYSRGVGDDLESAQQQVRALKNGEHDGTIRAIREDAEIVNEFDQRMRQPGPINEQALEAALARTRTMIEQGMPLGQILSTAREEISAQLPVWSQRREALEQLAEGLRHVAREADELDVNPAVYAWEEVAQNMRSGHVDAEDIDYVRRVPLARTHEAVASFGSRVARTIIGLKNTLVA